MNITALFYIPYSSHDWDVGVGLTTHLNEYSFDGPNSVNFILDYNYDNSGDNNAFINYQNQNYETHTKSSFTAITKGWNHVEIIINPYSILMMILMGVQYSLH